jgi:hypothetical protein
MRCMVIVKANKESEAGALPKQKILAEMGKYNEELVKAGVMLAAEGLHPSSKGKRIKFSGGKHTVTDGPFTETKELIAGFWLWQVRSMEEAVEWLKRSPFDGGTEIEIRRRIHSRAEGTRGASAQGGRRTEVVFRESGDVRSKNNRLPLSILRSLVRRINRARFHRSRPSEAQLPTQELLGRH